MRRFLICYAVGPYVTPGARAVCLGNAATYIAHRTIDVETNQDPLEEAERAIEPSRTPFVASILSLSEIAPVLREADGLKEEEDPEDESVDTVTVLST